MVSFLIPRSHTLEIPECPKQLAVVSNEKESPRVSFRRTSSKSPERDVRHNAYTEEKPSKPKPANYNSWFKSITSSLVNGGTSISNTLRTECLSASLLDAPTHVRRRTRSVVDSCKVFTSQTVDVDPRLPDHMRRPELQLRRIQGRDRRDQGLLLPSPKPLGKRSGSVERNQNRKHSN